MSLAERSVSASAAPSTEKAMAAGGSNEFLTFALGDEEYGIEILKVQEIRGYDVVTSIANAPAFIKGVINLRGSIVPIVDLRIKFNIENIEYNSLTVVIILNIVNRVVGIVVDSVSDVVILSEEQLKPVPEMSSKFDTKYIQALGTLDERMLILMDIEKLITSTEMGLVSDSAD